MKVIYLHHSGFIIELEKTTLIFDAISNIPPHFLRKGRKNYFFVTHSHKDHFDQKILSYGSDYDTTYIFSDDIPEKGGRNIHYTLPYQTLNFPGIEIETFASTDLGVSYFIKAEGKNIFHSGDLNWWDWDTKIRPNINSEIEERDFKAVIKKIEAQTKGQRMDVAFVPVDPRLGGSTYRAADYFINVLKPKVLIPMHFWEDFSVIKTLRDREIDSGTLIPLFEGRNEIIGNY